MRTRIRLEGSWLFDFVILLYANWIQAEISSSDDAESCSGESLGDATCSHRSDESTVFTDTARQLAGLLNRGKPTIVQEHMSPLELDSALGKLQPTSLGWHKRVGSFIELLEHQNEHIRVKPEDVYTLTEERFDSPVLVSRSDGGAARIATREFASSELLKHEVTVRPSYCTMLAFSVGVPAKSGGQWNPELFVNNPCTNCTMSLQRFLDLTMDPRRPMDLRTATRDPINLQIQSHGITAEQLPWLRKFIRAQKHRKPSLVPTFDRLRHWIEAKWSSVLQTFFPDIAFHQGLLFKPVALRRYYAVCQNPTQIGVAGSLRGLPFHAHPAVLNEAIVGRKLVALYPPREREAGVTISCPWPPWDDANESDHAVLDRALTTFFDSAAREPGPSTIDGNKFALQSCHNLSITALQWLVYEYAKLPLERRPLLVMMHPGDVLWIPDNWLHFTLNLDDAFYVFQPTCQGWKEPLVTKERAKVAMKKLCQRSDRFCKRYCHWFCTRCTEDACECDLDQ